MAGSVLWSVSYGSCGNPFVPSHPPDAVEEDQRRENPVLVSHEDNQMRVSSSQEVLEDIHGIAEGEVVEAVIAHFWAMTIAAVETDSELKDPRRRRVQHDTYKRITTNTISATTSPYRG